MKKNKVAEHASDLLKQYSQNTGEMPRGTTDTSPLEQWLMIQHYYLSKSNIQLKKDIKRIALSETKK